MVSRSPNGAAFSGQTAVQLREIMAQKIFLVAGATGATGCYAVERLLERGHAVRALAHREDDRSACRTGARNSAVEIGAYQTDADSVQIQSPRLNQTESLSASMSKGFLIAGTRVTARRARSTRKAR